jgi:hypothetical protein
VSRAGQNQEKTGRGTSIMEGVQVSKCKILTGMPQDERTLSRSGQPRMGSSLSSTNIFVCSVAEVQPWKFNQG